MSELTTCCHCDLLWIREQAEKEGRIVTLRPGGIGTKVFVHKVGEALAPWNDDDPLGVTNQVAEMVEISDSCRC